MSSVRQKEVDSNYTRPVLPVSYVYLQVWIYLVLEKTSHLCVSSKVTASDDLPSVWYSPIGKYCTSVTRVKHLAYCKASWCLVLVHEQVENNVWHTLMVKDSATPRVITPGALSLIASITHRLRKGIFWKSPSVKWLTSGTREHQTASHEIEQIWSW